MVFILPDAVLVPMIFFALIAIGAGGYAIFGKHRGRRAVAIFLAVLILVIEISLFFTFQNSVISDSAGNVIHAPK